MVSIYLAMYSVTSVDSFSEFLEHAAMHYIAKSWFKSLQSFFRNLYYSVFIGVEPVK